MPRPGSSTHSRSLPFFSDCGVRFSYVRRAKRTPKLKVIQKWCKQILEGLDYLHTKAPDGPIIHRDLKCDNIFINGNQGDVKLGDFGLSTLQKGQTIVGTPEFMAPEMYNDTGYTEKVDIYAFGMCLLEITTGKHPYSECQNAAQIYKKVTAGTKPDGLKDVEEKVVQDVILLCLQEAESRPTAAELLQHDFLTQEAPAPAPEPAPSIEVPRSSEPEPSAVPPPELPAPVQSMAVDEQQTADGVIAVSMKVHVRGVLTKVDFTFDVGADKAETVADEMMTDLSITKEQHMQVIKFIEQAVAEHAAGVMPCTKTVVQSGSTHGMDEAAAAAPAPLADTPATGQLPPAGSGVISLPDADESPQRAQQAGRRDSAPNLDDSILGPIKASPSTQSNASAKSSANSNSSLSPTMLDADVAGLASHDSGSAEQPRSAAASPTDTSDTQSRGDSAKDLLAFLDPEPASAEQAEQMEQQAAEPSAVPPPSDAGSTPAPVMTPQMATATSDAGSQPLDLMDFGIDEPIDAPLQEQGAPPRTSPQPEPEPLASDRPVVPLVTLSVDTEVKVVGLINAKEHNGKKGFIRSYDDVKMRYVVEVELPDGTVKQLSLKPANVELPEIKKDPFELLKFDSVTKSKEGPKKGAPPSPMRGNAMGGGGSASPPPAVAEPQPEPSRPVTAPAAITEPIAIPFPGGDAEAASTGSPDKSAIEDLLKGAKKEEILRVQKLVNARVAALDEGQSPPNGSGVPAADGGEGGDGLDAAETGTLSPHAGPLEQWVADHVPLDTANPEVAHETAEVVTTMLDEKLRAISKTGLDSLGKSPGPPSGEGGGGGGAPR